MFVTMFASFYLTNYLKQIVFTMYGTLLAKYLNQIFSSLQAKVKKNSLFVSHLAQVAEKNISTSPQRIQRREGRQG